MAKEILEENSDKINNFIKIYKELIDTLTYDKDYAEETRIEDGVDELSAYQIKEKDVERTKKEKRGDSKTFSMRLSEELDSLGIENYLIQVPQKYSTYWANLYNDNGQWMVADITTDIIYGSNNKFNNLSICPREEFLIYNGKSLILEDIKDDGKMIEDLDTKQLSSLDLKEEEKGGELIVIEQNIFKRIINYIKDSMKQIITKLGLEKLFEPYEPPQFNEVEVKEKKKEDNKEGFVPKAQVDEKAALKVAEERVKNNEIKENTKE